MLKKLDKRNNTTGIHVEPNEGEGTLLSSNESGIPSPSLDYKYCISQNNLERAFDILFEEVSKSKKII